MRKLFLSIGILLITIFGFLAYSRSHHFTNLDPKDQALFLTDPITHLKQIKIPGFAKAYNPSMIAYKEGYLLSFRVNHYNLATFARHLLNHKVSYLGIVPLNTDFEISGKANIIHIEESETIQDVRMVQASDKIYLFFNKLNSEIGKQKMYFSELAGDSISRPKCLSYSGERDGTEKNWTPFVHDDTLFAIYQIDPLIVLKVNTETGECSEVTKQNYHANWQFGSLSGGTPAVPINQGFLSFFHSYKKGLPSTFSKKGGRVYFMGAYFFEDHLDDYAPFKITKISPFPLGDSSHYENNRKNVVYPGGIVIEKDKIHIAWGKDDTEVWVTTFDRFKLLSSLKEVTFSNPNF